MITQSDYATTPAELAWSQADEPSLADYDDSAPFDAAESSLWWTWPAALTVWAVCAAVLAIVVGVAIMTHQQPSAPPQQQPMTTYPSLNAGTIVPFPSEAPQNT